jgi:hypothetical protein
MSQLTVIQRLFRERCILTCGRLPVLERARGQPDIMQIDGHTHTFGIGQLIHQLHAAPDKCQRFVIGIEPQAQASRGNQCADRQPGVTALYRMMGPIRGAVPIQSGILLQQIGDLAVHDLAPQRRQRRVNRPH